MVLPLEYITRNEDVLERIMFYTLVFSHDEIKGGDTNYNTITYSNNWTTLF